MDQIILRLPTVQNITGAKRSTIYAWIKEGTFPKPVRLGERSVGWLKTEVQAWVNSRITKSRGNDTHPSSSNISTQISEFLSDEE